MLPKNPLTHVGVKAWTQQLWGCRNKTPRKGSRGWGRQSLVHTAPTVPRSGRGMWVASLGREASAAPLEGSPSLPVSHRDTVPNWLAQLSAGTGGQGSSLYPELEGPQSGVLGRAVRASPCSSLQLPAPGQQARSIQPSRDRQACDMPTLILHCLVPSITDYVMV